MRPDSPPTRSHDINTPPQQPVPQNLSAAADENVEPAPPARAKAGLRDRLRNHPKFKHAYKVGVGVVGFVVLSAGIVMIPFPGPGWLVVIAGLAILATEFAWADRLLKFTKKHVFAWMHWIGRQALWVRILVGLLTAAFVYGVVVVALHFTGVPDWIPSWVPMWR
ncbi:MAG: TIGR02611 family protein [Cumulibacter sp.]